MGLERKKQRTQGWELKDVVFIQNVEKWEK